MQSLNVNKANGESTRKPSAAVREWFRSGRFLPWLVLAASLAVTHDLWKNAQYQTEHDLQADFDFRARETRERIEQRMLAYEQVLRGARSLFAASVSVERHEFRNYVANLHLEESFPGIQGVGFSQIVPPEQKDRHIAAVRKETLGQGYPEYAIRPEGQRDLYTSIVYLEPFSGRNLRAFGYDMYSEPVRRAAMDQARDTGLASVSGKVRLVQETEKDVQAGFLMYVPVYRNGTLHDTVAERRANILGWTYSPFRMNDLMRGIEGERAAELDVEIYDGDEVSDQTLMYDSGNTHVGARFQVVKPLGIAGHRWTLLVRSQPSFEARLNTHKAELIGLTGIGVSLLLALLTWSLAQGRARAEQAAREMNKELLRSEERARLAIAASHSALWDYDLKTGRVYLSEGWSQLLGGEQQPTYTTIQELTALVPQEEQHMVRAAILEAVKGHESSSYQVMHRVRRQDGRYIWVLSEGKVTERDQSGRALRMIGTNRDITERKEAEELVRHMAHHDALTDLPNRALLSDRITQALAKARRDQTGMAVMLLDLDKFKHINDTLGHDVGDMLLKEAAKRLLGCVRESDTVSRLGGDEFVILLPSIESGQDAMPVAAKILHVLSQPFGLSGHSLDISASIGIAIYPEHGNSEMQLLKNADIAMYRAKDSGRNNAQLYQPATQDGGL